MRDRVTRSLAASPPVPSVPLAAGGGPRRWRFLTTLLLAALCLGGCEERLIYFPHPYPPGPVEADLEVLPFRTDQGAERAYLRRPQGAFHRLWVFFPGNGGMARHWHRYLGTWRRDDALLLIEYPGYDRCEGLPSPATIQTTALTAIQAAAAALHLSWSRITRDCGVVGHSLGCATALNCAAALPDCEHLVLCAPFTSLKAMARLRFGPPAAALLRQDQDYDNVARLTRLAQRSPPPAVAIAHGTKDAIIPWTMGQALSRIVPHTTWLAVPGGDHQTVLQAVDALAIAAGR